jgi:hypothetical protein
VQHILCVDLGSEKTVGDKQERSSHEGFPPALETPIVGPSPLSSSARLAAQEVGARCRAMLPKVEERRPFDQADFQLTTQWCYEGRGFESQALSLSRAGP